MAWTVETAREVLVSKMYKGAFASLFRGVSQRPTPVARPQEVNVSWIGWILSYWGHRETAVRNPMRMWMVDPRGMCRQHLLGEHNEIHMLIGSLQKGISLKGYLDAGFVMLHRIPSRHQQLVDEMLTRGYKHVSPIPQLEYPFGGYVDYRQSEQELHERCPRCYNRFRTQILKRSLRPKIKYGRA